MNPFLKNLFDIIAIDTEHLNLYLTSSEKQYLNNTLRYIEDLNSDFYTNKEGDNLEVLLQFLCCHAEDIVLIWKDNSKKEILVKLYTSDVISGDYDCFHFDLSKFEQTFNPSGQELTLYRVGRVGEDKGSLGNSWAKDFTGLKSYVQSSSIDVESRSVFAIKVYDSEVLCKGTHKESELILKKGFKYNAIRLLDVGERRKIIM